MHRAKRARARPGSRARVTVIVAVLACVTAALYALAGLFQLVVVNGGRILTPWRHLKIDPLHGHSSVAVAAGTRPRSRFLSR